MKKMLKRSSKHNSDKQLPNCDPDFTCKVMPTRHGIQLPVRDDEGNFRRFLLILLENRVCILLTSALPLQLTPCQPWHEIAISCLHGPVITIAEMFCMINLLDIVQLPAFSSSASVCFLASRKKVDEMKRKLTLEV